MTRDEIVYVAAQAAAANDHWSWDLLTDQAKEQYLETADLIVGIVFAAINDLLVYG